MRRPVGSCGVKRILTRMKALSDIGLELSITGGITPADLPLFRDINVKAFIAGRALARQQNKTQSPPNSTPKLTPSGKKACVIIH